MLYNSNDYDLIIVAYDDNSNATYECIYYMNGCRYIDVYEYPPCDWEM